MFQMFGFRGMRERPAAVLLSFVFLAAGSLGSSLAPAAAGDDPAARDLTVEQSVVFDVEAPAPGGAPAAERLDVVAWVDRNDNTYALGEKVSLFVKTNRDAYVSVFNVGPSGQTTVLFPNAHQTDHKVSGNKVVRIPSSRSGASFRVRGPVGRELIKVIASTSPKPIFGTGKTRSAGAFATVTAGARSMARDLQVTMDTQADQEWDDYNKIITTVASR